MNLIIDQRLFALLFLYLSNSPSAKYFISLNPGLLWGKISVYSEHFTEKNSPQKVAVHYFVYACSKSAVKYTYY